MITNVLHSWHWMTRNLLILAILFSIVSLHSEETAAIKQVSRAKPFGKKIRPKVMVMTTFSDEFEPWKNHLNLHRTIDVPGVDAPIYYNKEGLFVMIIGETIPNCSNQLSSLLLDKRFDFRKTYWLLAGVAGINPLTASLTSVAWAPFIVNGDTAMEVDARQMPAEWPYGIRQIFAPAPNVPTDARPPYNSASLTYALNPSLAVWAYNLTKDISLPFTPEIQAIDFAYDPAFVNARTPPKVILGTALSSNRYWYGSIMTQWATDWVTLCTNGLGIMVMSDQEGYGVADWFKRFGSLGKVDYNRLLYLRGGTDYTFAPNLVDTGHVPHQVYQQALENVFNVAYPVVQELIHHYSHYKNHIPGP